jgi:hypothetical protein
MADRDRHRRRRLPTHRQRPRGPHRRTLGGLTGAETVLSMNGGPLRRRCSLDGIAGADAASANGSSRFQQTPGGGPRNPRPLADDRLRPPSASKVGNSPTLAIAQEQPRRLAVRALLLLVRRGSNCRRVPECRFRGSAAPSLAGRWQALHLADCRLVEEGGVSRLVLVRVPVVLEAVAQTTPDEGASIGRGKPPCHEAQKSPSDGTTASMGLVFH